MVANFIEKVLNRSVRAECQERIITDVKRHELEQMHQRLFKYLLKDEIMALLYPQTN